MYVWIAAGCGSSSHLMTIAVTPAAASIKPGATQQFKATGTYSGGSTSDLTSQVAWSSGTASVATIGSTSGLATAVASGSSVITATLTGVTGTANLTVISLSSIAITPNPASVAVGSTQQLTATGTYSDASTADISSQVTWNSMTPAVATISSTGLATGVTLGTSNITATLGTIQSPVDVLSVTPPLLSITVNPPNPTIAAGGTVFFTATGTFLGGGTAPLPNVTWTSGTSATATILANGIAVSQAAGSSTITATLNGIHGTTLLTVQAAVARSAYVSSTSDSNTVTYVLKTSSASFLPIASANLRNAPSQGIPDPSGRFVFLIAANDIFTANADAVTGRLFSLASTLSTSVNSNFGVVDPTGQYLYVASSQVSTTTLEPYLINLADGSLSHIGAAGLSVGTNLISVIVDRSGKYLYAIDNGSAKVFAFSIGTGGVLTALATPSYPTGTSPQYPAIDPTNTHLYIPNQGTGTSGDSISVYTINNADGSLTPLASSPFSLASGSGPTFAAVEATGKFLYVTNAINNTISGLPITAGVPGTDVAGSPFATGVTPVGIAIDPTNMTLAVANLSGNSISMFGLNAATGVLTPAAVPQVESPAGVFFINYGIGVTTPSVSPGAVFAANAGSGDISAFTSSATTGALTAAVGSPFPALAGNSFAAADLQGNFLFTGSASGTQIDGFSVNQTSGAPTALTGSPLFVAGNHTDPASALNLSPTEAFAYALDVTSGSVVPYTMTGGSSGTTVAGPGTPVAAFVGANNLVSDPQGDLIWVLGLSATNGILPLTTPGGFAASSEATNLPGNWTSGAVDASGQFLVAVDSTAKKVQSFSIVGFGLGALQVPNPLPDGSLTAVTPSGSVTLSGAGPWVVAFDPQDRAVFVADQSAGTVTPYVFSYLAGGTLGAAGTPVTVSANGVTNLSTDITGTYLYAGVKAAVAPGSKGAVAVYTVGAGGALTAVAGSPFTAGTGNAGIAATNVVQ
jgi:6-phosphogluconolactonase (cycloisomerase 2 family)/uncharacterized protein YjdB